MDNFKTVLTAAIDAALQGDLEALLMARMLLSYLRERIEA